MSHYKALLLVALGGILGWMILYTRVDSEMHDGILESGVVTESRQPRPEVYMELKRLFEGRRQFAVALAANAPAWRAFEAAMEEFWPSVRAGDQWSRSGSKFELWRPDVEDGILLAGVKLHPALVDGHVRPLVAGGGLELEIHLPKPCTQLHVLGNISLPLGYSVAGTAGEVAATYELLSSNGEITVIPLRWGFEVVQGNMIHDGTRILPVAAQAEAAIEYIKDGAREQYQILLYSTPQIKAETIASLRCKVADKRNWLALLAITAEQEQQP